jgi:hypothetical protein
LQFKIDLLILRSRYLSIGPIDEADISGEVASYAGAAITIDGGYLA